MRQLCQRRRAAQARRQCRQHLSVQAHRARRQDRFLDCRARELVAKAQRPALGEQQPAVQACLDVLGRRREHLGNERQVDRARHDRRQLQHLERPRGRAGRRGRGRRRARWPERPRRVAPLAQHLGDEERVAAGRGMDAGAVVARRARRQADDCGAGEPGQRDPRQMRRRQLAEHCAQVAERGTVVAVAQHQHGRQAMDATADELDQIERRLVGPVNVLEHQHGRRRRARQLVEHGAEDRRPVVRPRQQRAQRRTGLAGDVVQRPERPRRRQRLAAAPEDAARAEAGAERFQQAGLADAGLAAHQHRAAAALGGGARAGSERDQRVVALEQLRHLALRRRPASSPVSAASDSRLGDELRIQIRFDRFAAALRAVAGILDAAERHFGQCRGRDG